jgi:hypothetical protein
MGIATSQPKKRPVACSSPPRHIHFREAAAYALSDAGGLVPLEGLHHVWYAGFSIGEDLLEVMIMGTAERYYNTIAGCISMASNALRRLTRLGRLNCKRSTVALPVGEVPMMNKKSALHSKCSFHRS